MMQVLYFSFFAIGLLSCNSRNPAEGHKTDSKIENSINAPPIKEYILPSEIISINGKRYPGPLKETIRQFGKPDSVVVLDGEDIMECYETYKNINGKDSMHYGRFYYFNTLELSQYNWEGDSVDLVSVSFNDLKAKHTLQIGEWVITEKTTIQEVQKRFPNRVKELTTTTDEKNRQIKSIRIPVEGADSAIILIFQNGRLISLENWQDCS